jgi:hypothetical protein
VSSQATGTVAFKVGGAILGSCGAVSLSAGTATCTTTALPGGSNSLTAVYSGNSNYLTSTSSTLTYVVGVHSTSTSLSASTTSLYAGGTVTFTSTVSPSVTGSVSFVETAGGTATLCTATLASSAATCAYQFAQSGSFTVVAEYGGNSNQSASQSSAVTIQVQTIATTTSLVVSRNSYVSGTPVFLVANVSPTVTGSITFENNGVGISNCINLAVVSSSATCQTNILPVATALSPNAVSAVYSGNSQFGTSTSASSTVEVWPILSNFAVWPTPPDTELTNSVEFNSVADEFLLRTSSCDISQVSTLNGSLIPDGIALEYALYTGSQVMPGSQQSEWEELFNGNPHTLIMFLDGYLSQTYCIVSGVKVTDSAFTKEFSNASFVNTAESTLQSSFPLELYGADCENLQLCYSSPTTDTPVSWNVDWTEAMFQTLVDYHNLQPELTAMFQIIFNTDKADAATYGIATEADVAIAAKAMAAVLSPWSQLGNDFGGPIDPDG